MLPEKGKKLPRGGSGGGDGLDFGGLIAEALRTELGSNHQNGDAQCAGRARANEQ